MLRQVLGLFFVTSLLISTAFAQQEAVDPGHSHHGEAFDEGPRQAAYLMQGMSEQVHFPVQGLSDEAQRFFDQGICQQHGFWYFEAERSFRQVAMLQPECAMAYWGMMMANVENAPRAAGFAAAAVAHEQSASATDKSWIDAFAGYYQVDDACRKELQSGDAERVKVATAALVAKNKERDKPLQEKLQKQLIKDLGTIVYENPGDIEAKAFLALQIWLAYDWGGGVPIVSHTAVDSLLDQVFDKAPLHPANHYRIHLWDQEDGKRALDSAAVDGSTAPGIAHLWHMSGHIYDKMDRHAEAAWQQEASSRVDHAHMLRDHVMPFLIHNYGHNQEWLARSLSYVGRANQALAIAKNLAELPRHPKWNDPDDGRSIAGYARTRLVQICEDYELWDEAVTLCRDGHIEPSSVVKNEVPRLTILGRALFRLGKKDEAAHVVADVAAMLVKARAERATAIDNAETAAHDKNEAGDKVREAINEAGREPTNTVEAVLDLQRELKGEQLLAEGDDKAAVVEFEATKGFPKALLADAQVAAGEPQKAVDLLEAEVKARPNRFATAARLMLAYQALAKPEHEARIAELQAQLHGKQFDVEPSAQGGFAWRTGVLGKPGPGIRLEVPAGEAPLFPEVDEARFAADFGKRPPLASLGPVLWRPSPAPGFDLPAAAGGRMTLASGRPTLVVFYLGFGCLHCVQQLQALAPLSKAFTDAGIDVVAIGNDTLAKVQDNLAALGDQKFTFPMLADPEMKAFHAWRCFDDFERMPLHGTFLVDGQGNVRWQDISYEPFVKIDWLLQESQRLLALPAAAGSR